MPYSAELLISKTREAICIALAGYPEVTALQVDPLQLLYTKYVPDVRLGITTVKFERSELNRPEGRPPVSVT